MKKIKLICVLCFAVFGGYVLFMDNSLVPTVQSFSSGPSVGLTGAPDEQSCLLCHDTSGGAGVFTINAPANYVPGQTYQIQVQHATTDATRLRWGFQITSLDGTNAGAGTFTNTDGFTQTDVDFGTFRYYAFHTTSGTFPGTANGASWTFDWNAPPTNVGPVTFYAAGNQANNNDNPNGDQVYLTNTTTQPAGPTPTPESCDYCVLQFPPSTSVASGGTTAPIFGRIFEAGVTEPGGGSSSVSAQVGFGPYLSDPRSAGGWSYFSASFNTQVGNDDEYQGTMTAPAVGVTTQFSYTYRFSLDGGLSWTYADLDGNGSNGGLSFDVNQLGTMTVTPADTPTSTATNTPTATPTSTPEPCDYCVLQFPPSTSVASGGTTAPIFGRIFEAGVTEPGGGSSSVSAQVGFGPYLSDPRSAGGWSYFSASFNTQVGNDDEYQGTMTAPAVGVTTQFSYTYRFSLDGGLSWTYADLDGNGSNVGLSFDVNQLGTMTVTGSGNTPTATSTPTPAETPSISGVIRYGNAIGNPAPPRFVKNVVVCSFSGTPQVCSTPTGLDGQYTLTGFGSGPYSIRPTKNSGSNNSITSNDAARVAQGVSGAVPFVSQNQRFVADSSGNGGVTSNDAALIARFAAGLSGFGNTGQWKFFVTGPPSPLPTPPATYNDHRNYDSVSGALIEQDFVALLVGEASGNYNTVTHPRPVVRGQMSDVSEESTGENPITVTVQPAVTAQEKEIVIPVSVEGVTGNEIISYEFDLRYDPAVMQPLENPVDVALTVSRGLMVVTNPYEPGLLRVVVYGPMPIDENGVLLNLKFTAVGGFGSASPLTFERIMFNEGEPSVMVADGSVEISPAAAAE